MFCGSSGSRSISILQNYYNMRSFLFLIIISFILAVSCNPVSNGSSSSSIRDNLPGHWANAQVDDYTVETISFDVREPGSVVYEYSGYPSGGSEYAVIARGSYTLLGNVLTMEYDDVYVSSTEGRGDSFRGFEDGRECRMEYEVLKCDEETLVLFGEYGTSTFVRYGDLEGDDEDDQVQDPDEESIIEFEDENFLKALLKEYDMSVYYQYYVDGDALYYPYRVDVDKNEDGRISVGEAESVKGLLLSGWSVFGDDAEEWSYGIKSVEEISYFKSLEHLECNGESISSLNLAGLDKLITVSCYENQITDLNLQFNDNLKFLLCGVNMLTSLDLRECPELLLLDCPANKLTDIDVSRNQKLVMLSIYQNNLGSLDVGANRNLRELECDYNDLRYLDVSRNYELRGLSCGDNRIEKLDLSNNVNLEYLYCSHNELTSIELGENENLTALYLSDNDITELDLSGIPNLEELGISGNPLKRIVLNSGYNYAPDVMDVISEYGDIVEYR